MFCRLEIACFNPESVIIASKGGADRIELCDSFALGGITPAYNNFIQARKATNLEIFVMIRPRGGHFFYSATEFALMKEDIKFFINHGANGFVFGILNEKNDIHADQCIELINLAKPLPCTLHRAFDKTSDKDKALEVAISCGFNTILTSGFASSAVEGLDNLSELVTKAANRITIMPGGGIRSTNIAYIKTISGASYYHSSAIISEETAAMNEVMDLKKLLQ